jgi:bacterioferritin-associated ferredoxin
MEARKDPSYLRDEARIDELRQQLEASSDELERVRLRQQLMEAESPSLEAYEEQFVTHAKTWAANQGVGARAFYDEGVPSEVLERAGFSDVPGSRRRNTRRTTRPRQRRQRVTADQVRKAIPDGPFTVNQLQESSGASAGVVRKVINEELQAQRLQEKGQDPGHTGPGRAPTLYTR